MGEEDPSMYAHFEPMVQPTDIPKDLVKQEFLNIYWEKRASYLEMLRTTYPEIHPVGEPFEYFDARDAVVWIDPLDGTSDFVGGNLPAVTVLIGLSLKGVSRLGVVHTPFTEENSNLGRTHFGSIEHGLFQLPFDEKLTKIGSDAYKTRVPTYLEPFNHTEVPQEDHEFQIATSISHFSS